ncbi:MAG: methylated-DNA--[protein]-cysteine S-methyltransferase [Bacteroidales bacterium]|jgi:AraC family transcriptional regulator of adaptative response/methylated-DNA-[protein]-cysteine methyltransferase
MSKQLIYRKIITTPLGNMIACAIEDGICFLDFADRKDFDKLFSIMINYLDGELIDDIEDKESSKAGKLILILEKELDEYFLGKRKEFSLPLFTIGTEFQKKVWDELLNIPYGTTISYKEEAKNLNKEKAFRAVANANGKNKLSIIIPCHRVIASGGELGGYGGGLGKKEFLISLEKNNIQ